MLRLEFEGFIQVRLATDPDPCDEGRGVSGWTYALAGEPDLDRVIVLQEDSKRRVKRGRGPTVGVTVRKTFVNDQEVTGHPLDGARLDLLDDPVFEGRNWVLARDTEEPIDPFHIDVAGPNARLTRVDNILDANNRVVPLYRAERARWRRRQPVGVAPEAEVKAAVGFSDAVAWRKVRRLQLEEDLKTATSETARIALTKRIADLNTPNMAAVKTASFGMLYDFGINGQAVVSDALIDVVRTDVDWPIRFWIGGWDADALCAYMSGSLSIPTKR